MTLAENINRLRKLSGLLPLKESEVSSLTEAVLNESLEDQVQALIKKHSASEVKSIKWTEEGKAPYKSDVMHIKFKGPFSKSGEGRHDGLLAQIRKTIPKIDFLTQQAKDEIRIDFRNDHD